MGRKSPTATTRASSRTTRAVVDDELVANGGTPSVGRHAAVVADNPTHADPTSDQGRTGTAVHLESLVEEGPVHLGGALPTTIERRTVDERPRFAGP